MATAYTMRYGSANAGGGPIGGAVNSASCGLGDAVLTADNGNCAVVVEGGSMVETEEGVTEGKTGSGRGAISSFAEEVSTVICFVGAGRRRL